MASQAVQRSSMKDEARIKFKRDLQECLQKTDEGIHVETGDYSF
jgi:hypothetical protein